VLAFALFHPRLISAIGAIENLGEESFGDLVRELVGNMNDAAPAFDLLFHTLDFLVHRLLLHRRGSLGSR